MDSTLTILKRLADHRVEFVIVGGMASVLHGSSLLTRDVDVCIPFERENLARVLLALGELHPKQRMRPDRPPLSTDPAEYEGWRNLYVVTDAGVIDFLSEVTGVGSFAEIAREAMSVDVGGFQCRVMGLDQLIRAKRALGRPKDVRAAAELELIRQRRDRK